MDERLPAEVLTFLAEVRELCRRHGYMLTPSMYDGLQVWPLGEGDDDPLRFPDIAYRDPDV